MGIWGGGYIYLWGDLGEVQAGLEVWQIVAIFTVSLALHSLRCYLYWALLRSPALYRLVSPPSLPNCLVCSRPACSAAQISYWSNSNILCYAHYAEHVHFILWTSVKLYMHCIEARAAVPYVAQIIICIVATIQLHHIHGVYHAHYLYRPSCKLYDVQALNRWDCQKCSRGSSKLQPFRWW